MTPDPSTAALQTGRASASLQRPARHLDAATLDTLPFLLILAAW